MSRALDEELTGQVLAPTLLCDLGQSDGHLWAPECGKKRLRSSLPGKQSSGEEPSFLFIFLFSAQKGLNENQLHRQRILL